MNEPIRPRNGSPHQLWSWLAACFTGAVLVCQPAGAGPQRNDYRADEDLADDAAILQITARQPSHLDADSGTLTKFSLDPSQLRLSRQSSSEVITRLSVMIRFQYGRVKKGGALAYVQPDARSAVSKVFKEGKSLAFCAVREEMGWLKRPDGGYVRKARIEVHLPSTFAGEWNPAVPLAVTIRTTQLHRYDGAVVPISRFKWISVIVGGPAPPEMLRVAGGYLPRRAVRLVLTHARPSPVPSGARWIFIDRSEQVMSAYEGDRMILATLISTGKTAALAPSGLYRVFYKVAHDTMHGESTELDPVEEVPFAQYFFRGMSLHGAYWHDAFGSPAVPGCINLSMRDAEWLFGWAPPTWSPGLPTAISLSSSNPALYILLE